MVRIIDKQRIDLSANLTQDFDIVFTNQLKEFSTEFATAFEAKERRPSKAGNEYYFLLYNRDFPVDLDKLNALKEIDEKTIQKLLSIGKVRDQKGVEFLAAIFVKPKGIKLSEIIQAKGALDEQIVTGIILNQVSNAIAILHLAGVAHLRICLDKIYYEQETNNVILAEATSEYPGYYQNISYETFERMICHPASKSNRDFEADYYALGVVLANLIFGEETLKAMPEKLVQKMKFEAGSFDCIYSISKTNSAVLITNKTEILIRGLLHDKPAERWGDKEVSSWKKRQIGQVTPSRVHKHSSVSFNYNEYQYFSSKYLAYTLAEDWNNSKKSLKITDSSRWLTSTSKAPDIEKKLFLMTRSGQSEVVLPDDKLTRILYILDENGPIRYKAISFHPDGLGNLLCHLLNTNNKELLPDLLEAIDLGFLEGWISGQEQPENYKPIYMGYNPRKIKFFLRNTEIGFGIERAIYEANPYLTCQSEVLKGSFVIGLGQVLSVLERTKLPTVEQNFDRHLIAYIAALSGVDDSIKVKQLQNIPYFSKSIKLKICAIFALAQKNAGIISLPNITDWLKRSCIEVTEKINSNVIRKKILDNIDKTSQAGDLNAFFQAIADSKLIKKDILGFQDAKKSFRVLTFQKLKLKSQKNLDQIAYKIGLRISVLFSYLICSAVFLIVAFMKMY